MNTWFIVTGMANPISAEQLQSYYQIVKIVKGTYEEAVKVFNSIYY
jgi:hypothetical protein